MNIFKAFNSKFCYKINEDLWLERARWVVNQAKKTPVNSIVLDLGAGTCPYREAFNHCIYKTHDFKQNDAIEYGKIDIVSDITKVPLPDAYADVILCSEVLEHTPDPVSVIKEISRLLKTKGTLIVTAPLSSGEHQAPYHYFGGFSRYFYELYFPKFGLEIISIEPNKGMHANTIYRLWLSQHVITSLPNKGFWRLKKMILQIFAINIPTLILNEFEKRSVIKEQTIGYFVIAKKD